MQQRNDGLLRGIGDVESGKSALFGVIQHRREPRSTSGHQVEVQQLVADLQTQRLPFVHVHRRARGMLDAGPHEADQVRAIGAFSSHAVAIVVLTGTSRQASAGGWSTNSTRRTSPTTNT